MACAYFGALWWRWAKNERVETLQAAGVWITYFCMICLQRQQAWKVIFVFYPGSLISWGVLGPVTLSSFSLLTPLVLLDSIPAASHPLVCSLWPHLECLPALVLVGASSLLAHTSLLLGSVESQASFPKLVFPWGGKREGVREGQWQGRPLTRNSQEQDLHILWPFRWKCNGAELFLLNPAFSLSSQQPLPLQFR